MQPPPQRPLNSDEAASGPRRLTYSTVPDGDWTGRIALLVATGPSAADHPADRLLALRDAHNLAVVAVKEAGWDLPWADACLCVDRRWPQRRDLSHLVPPLWIVSEEPWHSPVPPNATFVRPQERGFLSTDPARIVMGCTSGFAALNFATLRGARRIVLVGYDYAHKDHQHHAFPHHNPWYPPGNQRLWSYWRAPFASALPQLRNLGCTVINASRGLLDVFPKMELNDAISYLCRMGPA